MAAIDIPAEGDIVEFTTHGVRHTAEVMLLTDEGMVLLDLFDGERPVLTHLSKLTDLQVFHPEVDPVAA